MYTVVAYQVASTINIKVSKQQLPWQLLFQDSDELYYSSSKNKFIYIFHYGMVSFFNMTTSEIDVVLKQNTEATNRDNTSLSLVMIDIDDFKSINDTYGHASGDESIKHAANMIKGLSRHQDLVARYGGEEFIILMPNTVANDAYKLTERIRIALESATLASNENHLNFTISAGVAEIDSHTFNLKEAMDSADKALYKAKNSGRNQSQLAGE